MGKKAAIGGLWAVAGGMLVQVVNAFIVAQGGQVEQGVAWWGQVLTLLAAAIAAVVGGVKLQKGIPTSVSILSTPSDPIKAELAAIETLRSALGGSPKADPLLSPIHDAIVVIETERFKVATFGRPPVEVIKPAEVVDAPKT